MSLTWILIVATALIWIAFDIWTACKNGSVSTISWQIYQVSLSYPAIPFALGLLMGHFFLGMHGTGCPQ